jgi:2-methylcitrate dehydratase PrpD
MGRELVKGCRGKAAVLFHKEKLRALDAAFLNAMSIDAVGVTDTLAHAHPGGPIIGTALAIAEEEGASGAELITAIVAGYEAMARVSRAKEGITPRFRGLPIFGPFGAAAAAGKLLKLNENEMTYALGHAANSSSGLNECWLSGTMESKFHSGLAARNGITAAILARAGVDAAETALDGNMGFYKAFAGTNEGLDAGLAGMGKRFMIMEAKYKLYPVCAENQISVDLTLKLRNQHALKAKDIEKVTEFGPHYALNYPGVNNPGPFKGRVQAVMSAQFCNAAAFLGLPVSSPSFFRENYQNPAAAKLAKKITLVGEKDRQTTILEVTLRNGKQYRIEGDESILTPSFEKVRIKFQNLASEFISQNKIDRISDIVNRLDQEAKIEKLIRELK